MSLASCGLARRSRAACGLELDPSAPLPEIARLAAAEQDCCRFFAFALTIDRRGLAIEVRAPDDALPVLHALFGVAA